MGAEVILALLIGGGALALFGLFDSDDDDAEGAVDPTPDSDPALGSPSADIVQFTTGADLFDAAGGDDSVAGGSGYDTLLGGDGEDTLEGEAGFDVLFGEGDADTITGGAGKDIIDGGTGGDSLDGGDWNDIILGREGDDTILGGNGVDFILGGDNDDSVDGGTGNDFLIGDAGEDTLVGGEGNDILYGNAMTGGVPTLDDLLAIRDDDGTEDPATGDPLPVDDNVTDILLGGAGTDGLLLGAGDEGTGGADQDIFTVLGPDYGADGTNPAIITDYTPPSGGFFVDEIFVGYQEGNTAPVITVADASGDTEIRANGILVAIARGVTTAELPAGDIGVVEGDAP